MLGSGRYVTLVIFFLYFSGSAYSFEAPSSQTPLLPNSVLRGQFVENHQIPGQKSMQSSGHFTVAPGFGLIWTTKVPFPTTSIITHDNAFQNIGGIIFKLPAKHLDELYTYISHILAADWNPIEQDFIIKAQKGYGMWQVTLTPRTDQKPKTPYVSIIVNGHSFIENIVMTKSDGSSDTLYFHDMTLSPLSLTPSEASLFNSLNK